MFNAEQIQGLPARGLLGAAPGQPSALAGVHRTPEAFFEATGAIFWHGGEAAYYAPGADVVQLPHPGRFCDAQSYLATKAHELLHWTGHPLRLARTFEERYGDSAHAMEELVAEIGTALLCADLGVTPEVRPDHAALWTSWLHLLAMDDQAIVLAAAHAQRAVDELHRRVWREAALANLLAREPSRPGG